MANEKRVDGVLVDSISFDELEDVPHLTVGGFQPNGLPKIRAGKLSDENDEATQRPIAVL